MIRAWIAIALLSASWLWGLGYFQTPSAMLCFLMVALAVGLLSTLRSAALGVTLPGRPAALLAAALLVPSCFLLDWPWNLGPLALVPGMLLVTLPESRSRLRRLAAGVSIAGLVLLVQSGVLWAYVVQTARAHELPAVFAWPVSGVAWLLGIEATLERSELVFRTLQQTHRVAWTWELLLDPATLSLFAGGLALLGLRAAAAGAGTIATESDARGRWLLWLRSARTLTLAVAGWLVLRLGLIVALYFHRSTLADPEIVPHVAEQLLSHRLMVLLLVPLVALLAWIFRDFAAESSDATAGAPTAPGGGPPGARSPDRIDWRSAALGLTSIGLAVALFGFALRWDPVGTPKQGRVMVVERHSTWEPTTIPYDTTFFGHDSGYNYAAIYDYCSRWFEMSRLLESDAIDQPTLAKCDVLILKTPTARFLPEEVDAIEEFVRAGGGLMMIGDHTNVFKSSTYLNDIGERLGFRFRNDLLFRPGSPYDQQYRPAPAPHPIAQHLPTMDFAVSCSVDPGRSWGRAAIRNWQLWNLPPDYHVDNYHPPAAYQPVMRYGAFIQLWAARPGAGRVLAFTDSTIFSNFCTFQPGKAELFLGMIDWLNRRSLFDAAWLRITLLTLLTVAAISLAGFGTIRLRGSGNIGWLLVAAAMAGLALGAAAAAGAQRLAMPETPPKRPLFRVVIDRTISDRPLSKGAFTQGDNRGFGLLEQWIGRLGYFTTRRSGPEAFTGDMLVVICPTRSVSDDYRRRLIEYVAAGGTLLVVDSPDSFGSTANSLIWPLGLSVNHATNQDGTLAMADGWPGIELNGSCEVVGGETFIWLDDMPVGAIARYGEGRVMAIGFGGLFRDAFMGHNWMTEPSDDLLKRFNLLFSLVHALGEDETPAAWRPPESTTAPPSGQAEGGQAE